QASDPMPITQESPASRSRNSTARTRPAKSAQNERTAAEFSSPGLIVTTRKIAARVSGADTGCATTVSGSEVASAIFLPADGVMSGRRPRIKTYLHAGIDESAQFRSGGG